MRFLLLFLLSTLAFFSTKAQQVRLSGTVRDTAAKSALQNVSVVLLRAQDSVLVRFGRTDAVGAFQLNADSAGKYLLLISFPEYATYTDEISLQNPQTDLGAIVLRSREQVLKEVVITRRMAAIKIVGDTTEYAADSFKVAEGATVEDLLKKLPGIQVDKKGKITAQGETVKKVLVDGEEFFSDDPAVVTKNLQSKTVSSVQVYDKKSETATFTGVDDGIREKVINLKLKDSMKHGSFGKAEVGGGTHQYYQNQGMINAFKGKRKLAAYGILSTTAQTGLDYNDESKYGGTDNSFSFDDETGQWNGDGEGRNGYTGTGLPKVIAGGGHYSNKWKEGKEQLSANYKAQQLDIYSNGSLFSQYLLPDSTYFSKQKNERFSRNIQQNAGGKFTFQKDSLTTLLLTVSGKKATGKTNDFYNTRTEGGDGEVVNENNRTLDDDQTWQVLKANASWQQKFRKKGRSLMVDANTNLTKTDAESMLRSFNAYFKTGLSDSVIQHKTRNDDVTSVGMNSSYTEPLSKKVFLALSYGAGLTNSRSARFSYNQMPGTGGDFNATPDSLYSSDYAYRVLTQKGGTTLRYVSSKFNIGLGARVFHTDFRQEDYFRGQAPFSRSYLNWAPQAAFIWNRSRMESLRFYYNGATRQPGIEQLQPFRQNTDPLNIAIGNPALKQEFAHTITLSYNDYKALSGTYTYANTGFKVVQDAINTKQNIDELGRRTYQYINAGSNANVWSYIGRGTKLKKLDLDVSVNTDFSYNSYHGFVNGVDNKTATSQYGLGFRLSKDWDKDDKMTHEITLDVNGNYRQNQSTLSQLAQDYRSLQIELSTSNKLFWKLRLTNGVQANMRNRFSAADQRYNTVVWNATLSRKILKGDVAEIRLSVFDILNQNLGFSRNVTNTQISEEAYTTIQRYGLLSFVWNFKSGMGGGGEEED